METAMQIMMTILLFLLTFSYSDVTMTKTEIEEPTIEEPTSKPIRRPIHPIVRHIAAPTIVHQDNHYNANYVSNCDKYLDIIEKKNQKISQLNTELNSLRSKEHARLQKRLKVKHNAELKELSNKKSSVKTINNITISSEPVE